MSSAGLSNWRKQAVTKLDRLIKAGSISQDGVSRDNYRDWPDGHVLKPDQQSNVLSSREREFLILRRSRA